MRHTVVSMFLELVVRLRFDLVEGARLDEIAVTCHASVLVELASASKKAAYLRFDIKRREVLTANVNSRYPASSTPIQTPATAPESAPTALDLPDVPADPTPLATTAKSATSHNGKKPATGKPTAQRHAVPPEREGLIQSNLARGKHLIGSAVRGTRGGTRRAASHRLPGCDG
jgi:hypothetical protein